MKDINMFSPDSIELSQKTEGVAVLNQLLADEFGLFTKTLNYHWNVTGPRFHSIHTFLEGHYHGLLKIMDDVAERVRILGANPVSTVSGLNNLMNTTEDEASKAKRLSANDMLLDLYNTNMNIQELIRDKVTQTDIFKRDPGTEDFLIGILSEHEKMTWMLKSHLI